MRRPTSLAEGQVTILLRHINDDLNVHACTLVEIVLTVLKDMLPHLNVGTGNCCRQCCRNVLTNPCDDQAAKERNGSYAHL